MTNRKLLREARLWLIAIPIALWTLILMAGRLAIPNELYEAASVDGASGWQKFKFVTWPSMASG